MKIDTDEKDLLESVEGAGPVAPTGPRMSGLATSSARPRSSKTLSLNRLMRRTYPLREEARRKG